MNEKIKQLALDAGIGFTLWDDSGREMIDNYTPEERLAKFADLIVQECVVQSMAIGRYNTTSGITPDLAIAIAVGLKKHFGVEE